MNSTVNFEKIIKGADAVLDCIPIVSTVTNAAQIIYKLAHRVDALSPVVPGLKTSIKIHILSKDNFDCFFASIPLAGNLIALVKLVTYVRCGFNNDLESAIRENNEEIVDLCLKNKALNDDLDAAKDICILSASDSNNEIFKKVLNSFQYLLTDDHLMECLERTGWWNVDNDTLANANHILNVWENRKNKLKMTSVWFVTQALKHFLRTTVAERLLKILPTNINFDSIQDVLLECSYVQSDEETRNELITKSEKPSLEQLNRYFCLVEKQLKKNANTSDFYLDTQIDTLHQLLDKAELKPDAIYEFISKIIDCKEFKIFAVLFEKYQNQLADDYKIKLLEKLKSIS